MWRERGMFSKELLWAWPLLCVEPVHHCPQRWFSHEVQGDPGGHLCRKQCYTFQASGMSQNVEEPNVPDPVVKYQFPQFLKENKTSVRARFQNFCFIFQFSIFFLNPFPPGFFFLFLICKWYLCLWTQPSAILQSWLLLWCFPKNEKKIRKIEKNKTKNY